MTLAANPYQIGSPDYYRVRGDLALATTGSTAGLPPGTLAGGAYAQGPNGFGFFEVYNVPDGINIGGIGLLLLPANYSEVPGLGTPIWTPAGRAPTERTTRAAFPWQHDANDPRNNFDTGGNYNPSGPGGGGFVIPALALGLALLLGRRR